MQEFSTPMMKQYMAIKKQYADCLLFFRLGDFYELFLDDAHIGSQVLDITLTSRPKGKDGRVPMAGVPYHAVDSYLAKLVKAGYKVAICEQMSEPNARGIVDREVVRVVTPGTMFDERALDQKEHNYLVAVTLSKEGFAMAACDISTGHLEVLGDSSPEWETIFIQELARLSPVECILSEPDYHDTHLMKLLLTQKSLNIFPFHEWDGNALEVEALLKTHFHVTTLSAFDLEGSEELLAAGNLIKYLKLTQKDKIDHIRSIKSKKNTDVLTLDRATIVNLELFSTIREHSVVGSLLSVLDRTKTAMGGRKLKDIMKLPLAQREAIIARHEAVDELTKKSNLRAHIETELSDLIDMERILSRLATGLGNARDLKNLENALTHVMSIKHVLVNAESPLLTHLQTSIGPTIHSVIKIISNTFVDEPPVAITDGGMIKNGIDPKRDDLAKIVHSGREWVLDLEKTEREKSGIGSLKVRYNKVFGFYIEVSKANVHLVPSHYFRKQTLVNGERFTTDELKEKESLILSAEEELKKRELLLFNETLKKILTFVKELQDAGEAIATLDCLYSFADLARANRYVRPTMVYSGEIRIKNGRHPVVETLLPSHSFVPNDCELTSVHDPLLLMTGPNMAGKSVFIRQIALIVYLSHIGSFVPASRAHISLVDCIFVRSGASDVITSGLSTFMVEMVETAYILNHATEKSLIVMDEIGRGTSTYDGISIAWAVAEYIVTHFKPAPKTLFATHYHELQKLEATFPKRIKNVHMAITMKDNEPVMLYTLAQGGSSHSFGVAVAKKAGVPESVIREAKQMLSALESNQGDTNREIKSPIAHDELRNELQSIDIDATTPLKALTILSQLKKKLK